MFGWISGFYKNMYKKGQQRHRLKGFCDKDLPSQIKF